ncbi:PEP-CTERM sorting domain-containing protein [Marichromatium bheemlicum]|uniref:PEP-CTERM sorting domain-containing protein n=1 Tax=Marichromatium bheemlicum TaxID=365339 RepID=A0ABX1I9R5_9GAMM|nr:PEP-CTERM sorting domain-containing protein [Marichromatium bheemlicum]NKN34295.1 PEP-CTERM sorting domain-containing protein [Marichromatium bheemlicum]
MKRLTTSLAVAAMLGATVASASPMYINLPSNSYDDGRRNGGLDPDTSTGIFEEFGYNQLFATSIYDYSDNSVFGSFFDTNDPATLASYGIPASGTSLDGSKEVDLVLPDCPRGQCDIDALSPLVPPLGSDNEGFLQTWDLQVEYTFFGDLSASGPSYHSGTFDVYFNDLDDDTNDRLVFSGELTGSVLSGANLDLFFDITFVVDDFLFIQNENGVFFDAHDKLAAGGTPRLVLDTNVNPPIPTPDELLLVSAPNGDGAVVRQTTLDGSITGTIPEPATLGLLGAGLLGIGFASTRRRKHA